MARPYLGTRVDSGVMENLDRWAKRGERSALVNFLLLEGFARGLHLEAVATVRHEDPPDRDIDLVVSKVYPARGGPKSFTHELEIGAAILPGIHRFEPSRCLACASLKERLGGEA